MAVERKSSQCFTLFEMLVIVDKVVTALAPCSCVYASVLTREGRGGEAEGAGERADGVVVIGRLFGEGIEERIGLWYWWDDRFRNRWGCGFLGC